MLRLCSVKLRLAVIFSLISVICATQVSAATLPNDPDFARQWYLQTMGAQTAWDYTTGGNVVVAVLDTGVDITNPELKDNVWTNPGEIPGNAIDDDHNGYVDDVHGWNFVEDTNDPTPQFSPGWTEAGITHGTVIAGIIGATGNNLSGIAGINWRVQIMPVRILDSQGVGESETAAAAIDYAVRNGARVLNFSFVTTEHNPTLDAAIARAARAGVLVVAAAGNNKATSGDNLDTTPMFPVCSDGAGNDVLGVAATDVNDLKADFSNYGSSCVDLSAPGANIISTQLYKPTIAAFNAFTRAGWNGTSIASPMVTGAAALLLAANPGLSRESLMDILFKTADPIDNGNPLYRGELGHGRVNIARAVMVALGLPVTLPTPVTKTGGTKLSFVVVGANAGTTPEVRVYSPDGIVFSKFLAYPATFRGGVRVAAGDLDGDGIAEIVTAPGPGTSTGPGPLIKVFDLRGKLKNQFMAYMPAFRGGVSVAVGNWDGNGKMGIVTGAGPGGGPHVRVFDRTGAVAGQFFAYDRSVTTGVNVAAGDLDGDGKDDIVTAPASRAGSQPVKYYNSGLLLLGSVTFLKSTAVGGVTVAVADVAGDAHGDIILSRTQGVGSITVITSGAQPRNPFTLTGAVGLTVGAVDMNNDGHSDILSAPATGAGKVRLTDAEGRNINSFSFTSPFAYGAYLAGVITDKP